MKPDKLIADYFVEPIRMRRNAAKHASGVPSSGIMAALNVIEAIHSDNNLANPIATPAVRGELSRILKTEPPRSWAKIHHDLWASLPIECRHVIEHYADIATKAVRKSQNEAAELRHKLKALEQKGIEENGLRQESIA